MKTRSILKTTTAGVFALAFAQAAHAEDFNIPGGDLARALNAYTQQTGQSLVVSGEAVRGIKSSGAHGSLSADDALLRILSGTGFTIHRESGVIAIVRGGERQSINEIAPMQLAQAVPARASVETVTVTSSKLGGADVQSIPIAITALSQEQLTATQTAGGPDLIKQVPNMTFTKTNFSGYSIQLRGIGTQAISVTTDPAVAVAFNDTPFIRNHFFEQEFYDVAQVAVLRGPQGTLYGRNATAGVVNLTSAKPSDQFEAMASGEFGNYHQRRFEGMLNLPIVDDRLDVRFAGEWTKRQGYSFNSLTDERIDGRDLWSGRLTIGWKPVENLQSYLIWEHFSEDDDRLRSGKQLCKKAPNPEHIGSYAPNPGDWDVSQGCLPASMYSPESFEVPNGFSLPYYTVLQFVGVPVRPDFDPYTSATQSQNLRVIESANDPIYKAKNDTIELNSDYAISPALTLTSQTGFNHDYLWATQDYNRFNTRPGVFLEGSTGMTPGGVWCDPQLGCSDRLVAQDLVKQHSWQLNQEFRFSSNFSGPLNFSVGANYLHYETEENYYVFINSLTLYAMSSGRGSENFDCLSPGHGGHGHVYGDPSNTGLLGCIYSDTNPIDRLTDDGHNYFLSQNPYALNSYAGFGELNYNVTTDFKLTGGLRWTLDRKHFSQIPSWLVVPQSWGYPVMGVIDQEWSKPTGRFNATWTPKFDFTDQTLLYGSFAHGYKAGGANPPGAIFLNSDPTPAHPLTFEPEYINAFEAGTKNTLFDGSLTFNATGFYYDYKGYQISQIVDRTSVNLNFDATVKGAEIETTWEPIPGLRFNFAGGYEHTRLADGSKAIDLIDRTAGNPDWIVNKPWVTSASNCIVPIYVRSQFGPSNIENTDQVCTLAYNAHIDPVTERPYEANPTTNRRGETITGYPGFDPVSSDATNNGAGPAPNGGAGFFKDLSGNELPNAPRFTVSLGGQYSIPLSADWAGTLRSDLYWQDSSWGRVFNSDPYDHIRGYTTLNLTLILTSQSGWQVMLFDKNVFNKTAITGTFLNSDDTGLTTNIFLTDPKLIGVRITKNW